MSLLQVVPDCEFLRWIPAFLVTRLDAMSQTHIYPPGVVLFAEGERHPEFHIVVEGHVRLDMRVDGRGRIPILTAGTGDVLAWSALLGDSVMTSSAVALDPVKTVGIDGQKLQQLCQAEHELGYHVMKQLAKALSTRLVATRLQMLDLISGQMPAIDPASTAGRPGREQG